MLFIGADVQVSECVCVSFCAYAVCMHINLQHMRASVCCVHQHMNTVCVFMNILFAFMIACASKNPRISVPPV